MNPLVHAVQPRYTPHPKECKPSAATSEYFLLYNRHAELVEKSDANYRRLCALDDFFQKHATAAASILQPVFEELRCKADLQTEIYEEFHTIASKMDQRVGRNVVHDGKLVWRSYRDNVFGNGSVLYGVYAKAEDANLFLKNAEDVMDRQQHLTPPRHRLQIFP